MHTYVDACTGNGYAAVMAATLGAVRGGILMLPIPSAGIVWLTCVADLGIIDRVLTWHKWCLWQIGGTVEGRVWWGMALRLLC